MKKLNGILVVNSFIGLEKFTELYRMLLDAAGKNDVSLKIRTTASLLSPVGELFTDEPIPDFVLFWDKDVYLASRLENAGIRLFNSAKAVELCDNKALTAINLSKAGVKIPKTVIAPKTFDGVGYNSLDFALKAADILGYPLVIKEVFGSFGAQVYLAQNKESLFDIIAHIGYKDFIMQEFTGRKNVGRDVRINIVGGKAVASMLRYNDHDFRSNISNGGSMTAYNPSEKQIIAAEAACKALGLDFAGVDVLFGDDGTPVICEVNSSPHFRSTLDCTGVNLAEHIIRYISEALS